MRPLQNCTHDRFRPARVLLCPAHDRFRPARVPFCHSRESGNPETRIHLLNWQVSYADRMMQKSLNIKYTP